MLYASKAVPLLTLIKMAQHFQAEADEGHRKCALAYLGCAFLDLGVISLSYVTEVADEPPPACFSHDDLFYAWRYLVDNQIIGPIEIIRKAERGNVWVCPHRKVGVDYRNRKLLCDECRKELRTQNMDGALLLFTEADLREPMDYSIEWPDEIEVKDYNVQKS